MREFRIQTRITNRHGEVLDKYLAQIGSIPMTTVEEEIALAQKIKKGGKEGERARNRLVEGNLRFVVSVAKGFQYQGLLLPDLIDEGNIGLVRAAEKFDETRGFKFISYAVWWIMQSISKALSDQGRIVRLPFNQVKLLGEINKEIKKFEHEHGRKPSAEELAELVVVDEEKINQLLAASGHHVSIDAPIDEDGDNTLADMLPADSFGDDKVDHDSMRQEIDNVLGRVLKKREVIIIKESFGIGCRGKDCGEIADQLNLTRERVRQIREKSITKLRESGYIKILVKYLGQGKRTYSL